MKRIIGYLCGIAILLSGATSCNESPTLDGDKFLPVFDDVAKWDPSTGWSSNIFSLAPTDTLRKNCVSEFPLTIRSIIVANEAENGTVKRSLLSYPNPILENDEITLDWLHVRVTDNRYAIEMSINRDSIDGPARRIALVDCGLDGFDRVVDNGILIEVDEP